MRLWVVPFQVFDAVAGLIGAVWLLYLGEWRLALYGIVTGLVAAILLPIVVLSSLVFSFPGAMIAQTRYWLLGGPFIFLGNLLVACIASVGCFYVFNFAIGHATVANHIPLMLFGYSVATSPWSAMATRDGNEASAVSSFYISAGYALAVVLLLLNIVSIATATLIFTAVQIVGVLVITTVGLMTTAEMRAHNRDETRQPPHNLAQP